MPSYSEQIESLITSRDACASEVLKELLNGYILESKKFLRQFHHILAVEAMLLRLKKEAAKNETQKMATVLQKLNSMSHVAMNEKGDFLSLFNAFFAYFPDYLLSLVPSMRARLHAQPFLFAAEKDSDAVINALTINSNTELDSVLANTLVDLVPVTFQVSQRRIFLKLLTTTAVAPLIRLLELAPQNYHNEIFSRLLTLLDDANLRFLSSQSVSQTERLVIIKLLGVRSIDLQGNTRTRATLFLLSCFAAEDLVLLQAAADSLHRIILLLPKHDQELMLNNIRLVIQKYVLESAHLKFKTIVLLIVEFIDVMEYKFEYLKTLIKFHAEYHTELNNLDVIREKIIAHILAASQSEQSLIMRELLENLTASNPLVIAKLHILKGITKKLSPHHAEMLHTCFLGLFQEYISLSAHDGLIELCAIYQRVFADYPKDSTPPQKNKAVLLSLITTSKQCDTGLALVKTFIMLELHGVDARGELALTYLYSTISDIRSHFLFISGCCEAIGEQALKYPARINNVLLALNECLKNFSRVVKVSALDAIAYLAGAINADSDHESAAQQCIASMLPLCWSDHVIIKNKAYNALGKLVKFLPPDTIGSLIDNGIETLSSPVPNEESNANFCLALTGFMPWVNYDANSYDSPKKKLLTTLMRILNSTSDNQEALAALTLLDKLAVDITEPLMTETVTEFIQLFHSVFTEGSKRALAAVMLLAPHCSTVLKAKIATYTLRQLTNDDACQSAHAALKSLQPVAPDSQRDAVIYILDRVFRLENPRHAAAMTAALIDITDDCEPELMLFTVKRAIQQLKIDNKGNTARDVLFKLADTVAKKENYSDLKAHFVNEYVKQQRNRNALSNNYLTMVSIIAKFYDQYEKVNTARMEIARAPGVGLRLA